MFGMIFSSFLFELNPQIRYANRYFLILSGFNCLGMRSNNPVLPGLEEAFKDTETYVYTIGDSVRARRIMEGTMEGRAILNVLESQGYLHLEPLE